MRTLTFVRLVFASSIMVASVMAVERDARACGGCFAPNETNTVVTDHRMILSIGAGVTTLYDQIRYQGEPSSFAWVLPIAGTAKVGLSSDTVFATLDTLTATQVQAPPRNCPQRPRCDNDSLPRASSMSASDAGAASGGVIVTKEEVVGPYETVQLRSTDPLALSKWLTGHGYAIPSEIEPVIAGYVREGFDFLALKLVPGQSVRSMQPVRITTAGASPVLPLRMVAAGTGATVGITLWVLGEGRYEPQNFPSFTIKAEDVSWTWATNSSNFAKVRETRNDSMGGNAWEVESSTVQNTSFVSSQVLWQARSEDRKTNSPPSYFDSGVGTEADAGDKEKTAEQRATEDLGVLFAFSSYGAFRATRMRSDLGRASLANDLRLIASNDQSQIATTRVLTKESDEPQCPYWDGCEQIGVAPRSVAAARNGSGGGCSNASASSSRTSSLVGGASMAIAAAALLAMGRLRRRGRR